MAAQQQGWELLAPPAPHLLEQGLWHGRPGSTTSTKEQLHKEGMKTHQQFKEGFGVKDEEQTLSSVG